MIYVTGDKFGDVSLIKEIAEKYNTTKEDILIILGNANLNMLGPLMDADKKKAIEEIDITLFCLKGSHDKDPAMIPEYLERDWQGAKAYIEKEFPSIIMAKDGQVYDFDGIKALVVGGSESVSKSQRIESLGWITNDSEAKSNAKEDVDAALEANDYKIDVMLTHTCPLKFKPEEKVMPGMGMFGQGRGGTEEVEEWLDEIEEKLDYKAWYCGHFKVDQQVEKIRFMYNDVEELNIK